LISRRNFLQFGTKAGIASATAPLWMHLTSSQAFAQVAGSYKAIVLVTMPGGNDGNNTVIPTDSAAYNQYASIRSKLLAIRQEELLPLTSRNGGPNYGLHPSLTNLAALYNQRQAAIVANVGTLQVPLTKQQINSDRTLIPGGLLSHPSSLAQWESSSTSTSPDTGWGGRIADVISSQSGSLAPVLDVGVESIFTVGRSVQAVAVQASSGTFSALPGGIESVVSAIAQNDAASKNQLVARAAQMRVAATAEQIILGQAQSAGSSLKTSFPSTDFGNALKMVAQLINGRSVVGASRQIFYCNQGFYDFHEAQGWVQAQNLMEFDQGIGAFMQALAEMGLSNQVLLCTHSDFGRTMQANSTGGTDHGWGNHQFLLGGGISGGQIFGSMPALDLGGSSDLTDQGIWIPTTAVTQMTAGVGRWMGLSGSQISTVFPDLANFPGGALAFS
jgi:uncharacterized protein (DUF1501 family)